MVHFDTSSSLAALITAAESQHTTLSQIALTQAAKDAETSEGEIFEQMAERLQVMKASVVNGLKKDIRSTSGLVGGMAYRMKTRAESGESLGGAFFGEVLCSALAVSELNACMGRIVAAPTAGSAGIVPACLVTLQNRRGLTDEAIVMGLFNTAAIGMVIAANATVAGAEGGCQAECGAAAAMAAGALTELSGGTPTQCGHAVALALKSLMGLICDPVAGLVEEPCVIRNTAGAAIALTCAELALAGIESVIPVDEVIIAMGEVGRAMPETLRETAKGGLAASPTGQKIAERLAMDLS